MEDIRAYLKLLKRWWWLLIVGAIIPMGVSYYFASQEPDLYRAKATLVVGTSVFQDPDPNRSELDLSNTLAAAYAELVRQRPVTEAVIERLGLEQSPETLASQIGTNVRSGAQLLEIQVIDGDPEAAALIANALADELIRRSPSSGRDPQEQEFIRGQLEELRGKIESLGAQIDELAASLSELTSAAEIQDTEERIAALEQVKSRYQSTYADLLDAYNADSSNVLSLFEPAVAPRSPVSRRTKLIVAAAGAAGLGLAVGGVLLMEYLDASLRWEGQGANSILEMQVLGTLPQVSAKRALQAGNPLSPVAQGVREIQASIFLAYPDQTFETLLVTSPSAGEGKSFTLANLAIALASGGNRVVVVDADMRRPELHELFDCPNVVGLVDALITSDGENEAPIPLQGTSFDNLMLLTAGRPSADPVTLLTSTRFPALLETLLDRFDMVLVDSPPVLGPPDAAVIATRVKGTILVVSAGQTVRNLARQARDRLLGQPGVNLLGLAVNRVKVNGSYYYYRSETEEKRAWWKWWRKRSRDDGFLTPGEAAAQLGISSGQVRRWCKSGRLPAVRKFVWWRVDAEGLERAIEEMLGSDGADDRVEIEQDPVGEG